MSRAGRSGEIITAPVKRVGFFSVGGVAGVAPSLDLGTGVLALQLRTPMVTAMAAATLQAMVPDRDVLLGIGISSPVVTQQWHGVPYGERPLDHVREYVALVRECLSGESVTFAGDFYDVKRFRLGMRQGERKPKIVIGALNPGMLALAGHEARRWEPKRLRLRLFQPPAVLARHARHTVLHISARHAWASVIISAATALRALPAPAG